MPIPEQFPCLGLSFLGMCSYNPAQPAPVYFTIGNAIAALGLTLAIQQFLKPIFVFRIRAYKLRIRYLILCVFLGGACAVVAMLLPNLPVPHRLFIAYPIVWELAGGVLIAFAYGVAAFISLVPARIYAFNLVPFVRAAARLLSAASDDDRVAFAEDMFEDAHNMARLIDYAAAWVRAERHDAMIEFERLKEIGAPLEIRGRAPPSAFYRFTYRKELEAASYAGSFLEIMADPQFCSALVRKCPWLTASMLHAVSERHLHSEQAKSFVQEIARQALINDESMMAKEVSYDGFGTAPMLSRSLFRDWFILRQYEPLGKMYFGSAAEPSARYVARLNAASQMMLETAIENRDYWGAHYMHGVESAYKNLFREISYRRYKGTPIDFHIGSHAILELCKSTLEGIESIRPELRKALFIADKKEYRRDLVHIVASIVYEGLESIANRFLGYDDESWLFATMLMDIYPSFGEVPPGMDPLQQQLAIKLIEKLQHNMAGMYPTISRVLLAVIGPYKNAEAKRTAFVIMKDAVYKELQKLPTVFAKEPQKIAEYLPENVTYDGASNTLTHTYRRGDAVLTRLSALDIPEIDLLNECNWRI